MKFIQDRRIIYIFFAAILTLQAFFSFYAWPLKARWHNVPPVPRREAAAASTLGDQELSYRLTGMKLQNMGDSGGESVALKDYNYDRLAQWFFLSHDLSPHSNHVSYLAAYYFGAVPDGKKVGPLIEYLRVMGHQPEKDSWRWLAQAVYMARYQLHDMTLAYTLANELASHTDPDLPPWAKQMPAFILNAQGDKEAAYILMVRLMQAGAKTLPPQEMNAMRDFICKRTLTLEEAKKDPVCQ